MLSEVFHSNSDLVVNVFIMHWVGSDEPKKLISDPFPLLELIEPGFYVLTHRIKKSVLVVPTNWFINWFLDYSLTTINTEHDEVANLETKLTIFGMLNVLSYNFFIETQFR